jgi:serine/threonine-protein kinase
MSHPFESSALWKRLEPALDALLELPDADRDAALRALDADDPECGVAARAILARDVSAMHRPVMELMGHVAGPDAVESDVSHDTRIGAYRIRGVLGEGGMGVVYHAERADGEFTMPVALKVVRAHGANAPDFSARFRTERQVLARLTHRNIARLLDGGVTDDGRPYLVMEFVDGTPLTAYAREHALSRDERLTLLLQVCRAVQHAHEHLIVHRDLKPSNVLVTRDGTVKLLDFGVAKVLGQAMPNDVTARATDPEPPTMLVTPPYASPEQLRGETVTTASDVYSLGVLAYELLTGRRPIELQGVPPHRWAEMLGAGEPPPASSLVSDRAQRPSRDLDAVLATALRATPDARYRTVDAFAADVRRVLAGEPVRARPATWGYRARRFWGRHRAALTASALACALLITFGVNALVQARRLDREATVARAERDRARRTNDMLLALFGSLSPYGNEATPMTPARLLDSAVVRIERDYRDQPHDAAALLDQTANAYFGVGDWSAAVHTAARAVALTRTVVPVDSIALASRLQSYGIIATYADGDDDGADALREALAIWRRTFGDTSRPVARALNALAINLTRRGFATEADTLIARALALDTIRVPFEPLIAAQSHRNAGHVRLALDDAAGAIPHYERALSLVTSVRGAAHAETGNALINLGMAHLGLGAADSAHRLVHDGLERRYDALGREHDDIAIDERQYAEVLLAIGDRAAAATRLAHADSLMARGAPQRLERALLLRAQGTLALADGRRDTACALLRASAALVTAGGARYAPALHERARQALAPCSDRR